MVQRCAPLEQVRRAAARGEKWRYHVEDAIAARAHALKLESPQAEDGKRTVRKGDTNFEQVPSTILGDTGSDWQLRVRGRFAKAEDILRLEGRALIVGVRHLLRNTQLRGHRLLFLNDNMALTLALGKGRSTHFVLNQTCRELLALSIAGDLSVAVRWIPSEQNPADKGSRLPGGPPHAK